MKPRFPDAAFRASRTAQHDLPLSLIDGELPAGLAGHLFILSPVGTVDSGGAPYPDGNDRPTVINGDGMVWRIDFSAVGDTSDGPVQDRSVVASSRIVTTPDFVWDEITKNGSPLAFAGFVDLGMLRASPLLGTRNFANTAFVPLPGANAGDPIRLVCAYDAGPPVEIDPHTLEFLGVIGTSWDAEALERIVPFPPILSTAHPFYDSHTGELFSVNYGRSVASMLETIPLFSALAYIPQVFQDILGRILAALGRAPYGQQVNRLLGHSWLALARAIQTVATPKQEAASTANPQRLLPENFLDLVWWPGEGDITRLPVFDFATGKEATVLESMHQVAVTRRFVLLLDTNFKLRFEQFYNNPFPYVPEVERLLRAALASRQGETSNLWVIARDDIERARASGRPVWAFKVPLPGAVHFLADYDDREGIRIQCAHGTALDIAEWVRSDDLRLDGGPVRNPLHGMITSEVDLSRLGHFVIDPEARRVVQSRVISDDRIWGIGLYAASGVPAWDKPPERLKRVFWFASGLWDDNYTLFIRSLYADYPGRLVPLAHVDQLVRKGGKPTTLFAVDSERFELADSYELPAGLSMSSPQFIPDRLGGAGWVTAVVWDDVQTMLWVFAAEDLARGPVAKLAVPAELGFSLHTAWLPRVVATGRPAAPPMTSEELAARSARLEPHARRRLDRFLSKLARRGGPR